MYRSPIKYKLTRKCQTSCNKDKHFLCLHLPRLQTSTSCTNSLWTGCHLDSLSTDEDLKRQLAGYDFSVRSLNGTTCSCTKCVPGESVPGLSAAPHVLSHALKHPFVRSRNHKPVLRHS
ncbi:hypothetical protein E2C01_102145 [Portunus trituberculatus]|uniref:Uncharacterized protein n=1 Tax=Portunus trituberculatus TaxID=210409 RepID=A0A5B7KM37_PORTR|nr:hypothetical protein [Portunus trituberculatus]